MLPEPTDGEADTGAREPRGELGRAPLRVLIEPHREIVAGADVVLELVEARVEVEEVDPGHARTIPVSDTPGAPFPVGGDSVSLRNQASWGSEEHVTDLRITYTTSPDGTKKASLPEDSYAFVIDSIRETSRKSAEGIAASVQEGHAEIIRNIDGLTDAQARYKPAPGDWSVLEVMAHIVTVKRVMAALCTSLGSGQLPPGFGPQFEEERAQDGVTAVRFETIAEAREAAEAAHGELLAFIAGVDAADTSLTFRHFFFGAMNARQWACFQRIHDGDHGPQILRVRASAGFPAA